jgi:hypothetical protein
MGCGNVYQKLGRGAGGLDTSTGYKDVQQGFGKYVVSYRGDDIKFCKKAGLYRVAQLCKEQGFRYFLVKDEQVMHDFMPRPNAEAGGLDEAWQSRVDPNTGSDGLEKLPAVGYSYRVEFSNEKTEGYIYKEPSEILNNSPVPGTKDK